MVLFLSVMQLLEMQSLMQYQVDALSSGQYWRLLSAHFIHLNWLHFAMNLSGILVLYWMRYPRGFIGFLPTVLYLALGISGLMWLFNPEVKGYVGFSGVLYGLFVFLLWRERQELIFRWILVLLVIWVFWQWLAGPLPSEEALIGAKIVAIAHVYGVGLAGLWILLSEMFSLFKDTTPGKA